MSKPIQPPSLPELTGTLLRAHPNGYGFIQGSDGNQHFALISDFPDRTKFTQGQTVRFIPGPRVHPKKAPRVEKVEID